MNASNTPRVSLLLTAGGVGSRMAASIPKQFIEIEGKAIIVHTLEAFRNLLKLEEIVITLPQAHLQRGEELFDMQIAEGGLQLIEGGESRSASVKNGLNAFRKRTDVVLIHDAVRPFIDKGLLERIINACKKGLGVVPVVSLNDSIREIVSSRSLARNRDNFKAVQTPQAFYLDELKAAYNDDQRQNFTDDASLFESAGGSIILVEGSLKNIKITNPIDLKLAQIISKQLP